MKKEKKETLTNFYLNEILQEEITKKEKYQTVEHKEFFIRETNTELIVGFPFNPRLIEKCKTIFPHKFDKPTSTWRFPILIREQIYSVFGMECPPRHVSGHFTLTEKPSEFLMNHQKKCLELSLRYPKLGFFAETGTGKTLTALEILKHKKEKALIVGPLSTLETVWINDATKFYPELNILNLYPYTKEDRVTLITKHNAIHVINYDGFKQVFKWILEANYKTLIIEESSKLKGRTTDIAKKLIEFSNRIESVYLLSGTPAPNTKIEFYAQIECVSPGLLGYSFHSFRNHYFHPVDKNGYTWVENTSTKEDLINRLKKVSIFISKSDVLDLPEKTFTVRECEMGIEQRKIYNKMKNEFITDIGDITVISPSVLSKIMRLRQITSGFIYYQGESIRFADTKIKLLKEVLEEIGNQQIIIWCIFKEEIKKLLDELPESRAVYGETGTQDEKNQNIIDFKAGKYQYLLANPQSIAHGQTLTNTSYCIYFSLDYSNESWLQSQDRIHRIGQKNACTYIILQAKNSIDGIIYHALQKKEFDSKELLNHLKGK